MINIKVHGFEFPENIARINVIIIISWFFLTLISFFISLFTSYKLLVLTGILLILIIPITIIIKVVAKKLTKEVILTKKLELKDNTLYLDNKPVYVYYEDNECYIYGVVNHIKYRMGLKVYELKVVDKSIKPLLDFCKDYKVEINQENYFI